MNLLACLPMLNIDIQQQFVDNKGVLNGLHEQDDIMKNVSLKYKTKEFSEKKIWRRRMCLKLRMVILSGGIWISRF